MPSCCAFVFVKRSLSGNAWRGAQTGFVGAWVLKYVKARIASTSEWLRDGWVCQYLAGLGTSAEDGCGGGIRLEPERVSSKSTGVTICFAVIGVRGADLWLLGWVLHVFLRLRFFVRNLRICVQQNTEQHEESLRVGRRSCFVRSGSHDHRDQDSASRNIGNPTVFIGTSHPIGTPMTFDGRLHDRDLQ